MVAFPLIRWQTATFEAERQSFYDNEQHLKSRIQSLTQARKQTEITSPSEDEPETEEHESEELENKIPDVPQIQTQNFNDPETEPAEMTSLRLELSTLSTSYSSLQSTLALLRTQLVDLKRVNHELQEENESFMILLRERTLSGQFDVMKQVDSNTSSEEGEEDADESEDVGSIKSIGHGTLGTVEEMPEESEPGLDPHVPESHPSSSRRRRGEAARKRGSLEPVDKPRGESLADLPITGPGLDLASELGRAESKDVLESPGDSVVKSKRGKKDHRKSLLSDDGQGPEQVNVTTHIDALRLEVKSLKDANKALSLYASKIIDRIISVEGFEHVLAVDYDKEPTPSNASKPAPAPVAKPPAKQPRPQSLMVNRSTSSPVPSLDSFKFGSSPQTAVPKTPVPATPAKANRRSLSFDWKSFSMFSGEKKAENPSLRPLKLKPGSNAVTGARKLETEEDDDDRRERERLNATMKLMGITQASQSPTITTSVPMQRNSSSPATASSATTPNQSRFSFFRSLSTTNSETASLNSVNSNLRFSVGGDSPSNLTTEALRQAEAEESLAALDAHERALSAEIARGASGGLTEILPRSFHGEERSRRSRKSRESGSTVWSAGMEDNL